MYCTIFFQIYAITSSFPLLLGSNAIPFRPAKMEIKVISTNPAIEGAVSYVSDDCLEDYGIDPYNYNAVFGEVNNTLHQTRKKRAVVQTNITPKCFNWKDIFHSITRYLNTITTCRAHHHNFIY